LLAPLTSAFCRLGDHNWDADPLIVDLAGEGREIRGNSAVQDQIVSQFRALRDATTSEDGPSSRERRRLNAAMYVVSSADRAHGYWPSLAAQSPERVVLGLVVNAAKVSAERLLAWMQGPPSGSELGDEAALEDVMGSDAVLSKCDVVLKFNRALVNKNAEEGPAFATLSVFANTPAAEVSPGRLVVRYAMHYMRMKLL
jgi:hypothetical protein